MELEILHALRDPAGVPFYPVVFQGLYILTWALHALFVFLSLGAMGASLCIGIKHKNDGENWQTLRAHLIQVGKISVSLLIVLGVAPLLFVQVIYDPNWYTINTLSGVWIVAFIYSLLVAYIMFYWYYFANKKTGSSGNVIGTISFVLLIACALMMHVFSVEGIQPEMWKEWYAPNGVVDTSGTNFHTEPLRYIFLMLLAVPAVGLFLQNYGDFIKTGSHYDGSLSALAKEKGAKVTNIGLILSLVAFFVWALSIGKMFDIFSIVIYALFGAVILLSQRTKNSYISSIAFFVLLLAISGFREYLRYKIMFNLGYDVYAYPVDLEWPSIIMFLLTFLSLGGVGVSFLATLAWKVGKGGGYFDASKDKTVSRLASATVWILVIWCVVYFIWGFFYLFKNTL
ncbi:MAG: hypothetical protein GX282_05000 [Campylobacteraceae bacterium]|nr:hypothetical protein [Campylobacteraceae bacterium]